MAARTKWSIRVGVAVLIATVSVVLTLFVVALRPKPSVPLTNNLSGEWGKISLEFDQRVRHRFTVGSSELAMTQELRREGFVRSDSRYTVSDGKEATAMRSENNLVCNIGAMVYWRADAAGRITTIRGEYRALGCL